MFYNTKLYLHWILNTFVYNYYTEIPLLNMNFILISFVPFDNRLNVRVNILFKNILQHLRDFFICHVCFHRVFTFIDTIYMIVS